MSGETPRKDALSDQRDALSGGHDHPADDETPVLRRDRTDRTARRERRSRAAEPGPRDRRERGGEASSRTLRKLLIAVVFAVPFAWDVVEAIADLAALLAFADAAGHPLNSYAWLVLGTAIVVPPAAFTTALLIGWTRGPLRLAAALGVALAATAAISLSLEALLRA
jgi:hypothetical protein